VNILESSKKKFHIWWKWRSDI